jgi:lipoate-protein ligase A
MEKDGVTLMRRYSGGGAVYHDMGNGVFTFLSPKAHHDVDRNLSIVVGALRRIKVNAEATGRNDITVEGRKVSGSAFKNAKDKAIHHGTFLYNVNINSLSRYLTPSRAKLQSKGVDSVAARVTNIRDVNPDATFDQVNDALVNQFLETYGGPRDIEVQDLSPVKLNDQPSFARYYAQLSDWSWRFGKTPEFEHHLETRFDWGQFDLHIQSKHGIIDQIKIYSDCLNPAVVEELERALAKAKYSKSGIQDACEKAKKDLPSETARHIDQFAEWLASSL